MIGDTIDMMDDEDIEEAADEEVNNVIFDITDGLLGEAGTVGAAPEAKHALDQEEDEEDEEEGPELDMMQKRLQVLYMPPKSEPLAVYLRLLYVGIKRIKGLFFTV